MIWIDPGFLSVTGFMWAGIIALAALIFLLGAMGVKEKPPTKGKDNVRS